MARKPAVKATVTLSGELFKVKGRPVRGAMHRSVNELIEDGVDLAKAKLSPGHGVGTGRFKGRIRLYRGRSTRKAIRGYVGAPGAGILTNAGSGSYAGTRAVLPRWVESGNFKNRPRGRFRGYHMFRDASRWMQGKAQAVARPWQG